MLTDFSKGKYNDKGLVIKARFIFDRMTDNTYFPTPDPTLETLKAATDEFETALEKTEDGTHEDTVIKNQKRANMEGILRNLAAYVQNISQGDQAIILSSGNDASRPPTPPGPLDPPIGLTAAMGSQKGSVILSCNPIKHIRMYLFEYRLVNTSGDSIWTQLLNTKHKIQIDNLVSLQQYEFRAAGAGSDPSRNYCNSITTYIL